jgi:hypothetical protein
VKEVLILLSRRGLACSLALMVFLSLSVFGCAARKPEPDPKPSVVPEVTKVFFTRVDLEDGPQIARSIVEGSEKEGVSAYLRADNRQWVLLKDKEGEEGLEVVEVLLRVPATDYQLLHVRVREAEEKNEKAAQPLLLRLELQQTPDAVEFEVGDGEMEAEAGENEAQVAPTPAQSATVTIEEPDSGEAISSPVEVKGRVRAAEGVVIVRLMDSQNKVLAENREQVQGAGEVSFSSRLSFQGTGQGDGTIEVLVPGANSQIKGRKTVKVKFAAPQ